MKTKKKLIIVLPLLAIICIAAFFCFSDSKTEDSSATQKTMLQYSSLNLTFEKPENEEYKCSVTNNDKKIISVDAYNEGEYYWLNVNSDKSTRRSKPIITVYKETDGKKRIIKKYQITVSPYHKVDMKNIKINEGTKREIKLINPYYDTKEYDLRYNEKKIKLTQVLYDGEKCYYILEGLKKGKSTVKAYLSQTNKLIGSFTVTVGDYEASIKTKKHNITLYYNPHIDSRYLENGSFNLGKVISNYHSDAVYSVFAENPVLIGSDTAEKENTTPKAVTVYSKNIGKTKLTVFEKRKNENKKQIGIISLTIKKAKDSEVFSSNMALDNDGIFYENFIMPGDEYNLKNAVVSRYINSDYTNSHFSESEYTFTARSNHPEIISVDKNGVCKCHTMDKNAVHRITYTVTFKDGSKITNGGAFDIVDEDFY
ncbi:MAG: hypothetical protein IJR70_04300 [Eubacterium sp.]|nr:hypothetical protein [Eubacterium sp.]